MADHPTSPCSSCPYRKDAKLRHWSNEEFRDLLASERTQLGTIYGCHGHVKVPPAERGMCAGWLLDQKKRGVPSIMLRLRLTTDNTAVAAYNVVNDGGHELYKTVKAMCRANGVRER